MKNDDVKIFIGEEQVGICSIENVTIERDVRFIPEMEYYYRRGNKYFLRSKDGQKLAFETEQPQEMPKRGSLIDCKFTMS